MLALRCAVARSEPLRIAAAIAWDLLGRQVVVAAAGADALGVDPGVVAAGDRGHRQAVTVVVEQGERERHPPGHLVERVVTHQRDVADRVRERGIEFAAILVQPGGRLIQRRLDLLTAGLHGGIEGRAVRLQFGAHLLEFGGHRGGGADLLFGDLDQVAVFAVDRGLGQHHGGRAQPGERAQREVAGDQREIGQHHGEDSDERDHDLVTVSGRSRYFAQTRPLATRNLAHVTVRLSSSLTELPRYVPGQSVPGAIKLASNETPYPPLPHVLARILQSAQNINRYPDTASIELCERLAMKLGVNPEQVVAGCGSVSLCGQLVRATADVDSEVIYAWRSFEAYPIVAALGGARSVQVPLTNYMHDLDAMAACGHRAHPVDLRLQPEQPDRHAGRCRGVHGVHGSGAVARPGRIGRGVHRVRARPVRARRA